MFFDGRYFAIAEIALNDYSKSMEFPVLPEKCSLNHADILNVSSKTYDPAPIQR
jgi:hypothetical protein